jgi:hypothetical protein
MVNLDEALTAFSILLLKIELASLTPERTVL